MTQIEHGDLFDEIDLGHDEKLISAIEKSDVEDKVSEFISLFYRYIQHEEPAKRYRKFFQKKTKDEISRFFADVKNTYRILVLNGEWNERKLVEMIDLVVDHRREVNQYTLTTMDQMRNRTAPKNSPRNRRTKAVKESVSPQSKTERTPPRRRRRAS